MSIENRAAAFVAAGVDDDTAVSRIRTEASPEELEAYLRPALDAARRRKAEKDKRDRTAAFFREHAPQPTTDGGSR